MNGLKTTMLLALLTGLLIVIGGAIGQQAGVFLAFIMALVMNFVSYWFSDKIVLSMYGAKEIGPQDDPRFYGMVQRLAQKAGLPMPKVYIIEDDSPNAFATGRNPKHAAVAATTGIMRLLTDDELSGVMAHELAHVKHRDTLIQTVAATVGGAITFLAHMAIYMTGRHDDEEGGLGIVGSILMMILAPIAAMLIQMAISRSREYVADEGGASICGNPLFLARALQKLEQGSRAVPMDANPATASLFIVNPLTGGGFSSLFSTHPPIQVRVERLEEMARH
jgi:heat shock protein HtpX